MLNILEENVSRFKNVIIFTINFQYMYCLEKGYVTAP